VIGMSTALTSLWDVETFESYRVVGRVVVLPMVLMLVLVLLLLFLIPSPIHAVAVRDHCLSIQPACPHRFHLRR